MDTPNGLVIEPAQEADASELAGLYLHMTREPAETLHLWRQYIGKVLGSPFHFIRVARQNGVIVGYIDYRFDRDRRDPDQRVGVIEEVFVINSLRRRGVAAALAKSAVNHLCLLGATAIDATFDATDESARAFWDRQGFRVQREVRRLNVSS